MDSENLLYMIEQAFAWRQAPQCYISSSSKLFPNEIEETLSYQGKDWRSFKRAQLQKNYNVLYYISPEAYCYCLPGVMSAVIRENQADLLMVDSILSCLDRPPRHTGWDDFFLPRWTKFTLEEYDAIEQWLWWLCEHDSNGGHFDDMLTTVCRCIDTLNLLREEIKGFEDVKEHHGQTRK